MRIDILFLRGSATATSVFQPGTAEWPPHPDRLFQALVAAWGASGKTGDGEAALRWLEALPAPLVVASDAYHRSMTGFVPPNDRFYPASVRKERTWASALPLDPVASFVWKGIDPGEHAAALAEMCRHVSHVGQSSSIVVATLDGDGIDLRAREVWLPSPTAAGDVMQMRTPSAGRLAVLENAWLEGRRAPLARVIGYVRESELRTPTPASAMGEMIVLRGLGPGPRLRDVPEVARMLRNVVMSHSAVQPAPEVICGHGEGGTPSRSPHMAVVPLANVGWEWSDGRLMGIGVVLPRNLDPANRRVVMTALARWLHGPEQGLLDRWRLVHDADPERASLKPGRYAQPSTTWATVTPIALDRHPKRDNGEQCVADACGHAGLPRPTDMAVGRQAAIRGAPWVGEFRMPGRALRHAVVRFDRPVRGPIMLGAGRFRGLGLMLPVAA